MAVGKSKHLFPFLPVGRHLKFAFAHGHAAACCLQKFLARLFVRGHPPKVLAHRFSLGQASLARAGRHVCRGAVGWGWLRVAANRTSSFVPRTYFSGWHCSNCCCKSFSDCV
jgi:hypothetical protein